MAAIGDAEERRLICVKVPEGGTIEAAIEHLRAAHSDGAILNEMPIQEATRTYASNVSTQD